MKETRFFYVPDAKTLTALPEDESKHALRVLRLQEGDEITLIDGNGGMFRAEVAMAAGKHCMYDIVEQLAVEKEWHGRVHLAVAPTKMMDRVEWMAEKATEIGFDELTFLNCRFSERTSLREDRIDRILVSAMKQSHKAWKPTLHSLTPVMDFIKRPCNGARFIAHCYNESPRTDLFEALSRLPKDEEVTVMIGPEGDFSIDEVEAALANGFVGVSLGKSRLRTETAALSAVMMVNLSKRQ